MSGSISTFAPWTGAVVGACAWAAATQAGQILPYADCADGGSRTALACAAAVPIALAGAWISWISDEKPGEDRTAGFAGRVAALAGLVFAFALGLQGAASVLVPACAR
jgi:hypothetical protein